MIDKELEKKQFMYRGKTIEELKALDVREFAKFTTSRIRRTILKRFNEIEDFVSTSKKKLAKNKPIRTHKRDLIIVPQMIGMKIFVYNGKAFLPFIVTGEMLGHRLGEFAPTRGKIKHGSAGIGATKGSKSKAKK
jgi:small subunit ribosomal protein S19